MAVSPNLLKLAEASVMPASFSTADIGGGPTSNIINGSSIGEVHFQMGSAMEGGGDKVQRAKLFYINESTTDDLTSAKIWLANALDTSAGNDEWRFVSSSADDDDGVTWKGIGFDTDGDPLSEEIVGNGTSEVQSLADFSVRSRVETRDSDSGELRALVGTGTIKKGASTTIGAIPAGYYSATSEIDIWLPATLDDTGEADDAASDPSGVSWSRPRTFAGGLAVANSGTLTHETGQGIWSRWTVAEEALPSADIQVVVAIQGDSA